ncbi:MFS transporter [Sciscionella marina]|uniref:MFS transporter n=1 Tax=Sciscionella marina TaxID=508770 RepID=UPI000686A595|nr:MFS transporter [Sciscionella marina]
MPNTVTSPVRNKPWKVVLASYAGNALEWYDFFLYATAAALVLNKLFFPPAAPLIGTLASLGTFAVGFLARPIGGVIFAHFGDRIGRKKVLVVTLSLMGISTFLIGVLPTYHQIGVWAPILLVLLRVIQGAAVGGEWGGGVLLISEHVPACRRGFYSSWSQTGVVTGSVLSSLLFAGMQAMPSEQFLSWGWRIPFLLSILAAAIGLAIRSRISEAPEFTEATEQKRSRLPAWEAIRKYPRSVLITLGARLAENGASYIFLTFSLAYGTHIGLGGNTVLIGVVVASAIEGLSMVGFGALSDRIGRRPVYLAGAIGLVVFAFPFFLLFDTRVPMNVWLALTIAVAGCHGAMIGTQPSFFSELFGANVRYSGMSLGHELASVIAGGLSPIIAVGLLGWAGSSWPVAVYLIVLGVLTAIAVFAAKETRPGDRAPDKQALTEGAS